MKHLIANVQTYNESPKAFTGVGRAQLRAAANLSKNARPPDNINQVKLFQVTT